MQLNNLLTFLFPIIDKTSKGKPLKTSFAILFIIIGILTFGFGIYILVNFINDVPDIWFTLSLLIIVVASFLIFQIWFFRANEIYNLDDQKYYMIPVFEKFIRAVGESLSLLFITMGVAGIPIFWFSRYFEYFYKFISYLPLLNHENTFLFGLLFFVVNILIALVLLGFHYLLAESLIVLIDIENNTRKKV